RTPPVSHLKEPPQGGSFSLVVSTGCRRDNLRAAGESLPRGSRRSPRHRSSGGVWPARASAGCATTDRSRRPRPSGKPAHPSAAPKLGQRLAEASKAYERARFTEARKLLKPLAGRVPGSASVRELYGLTLYRLGHWKLAVVELEAFRRLTGSTEQHPVLADCYRALKPYR